MGVDYEGGMLVGCHGSEFKGVAGVMETYRRIREFGMKVYVEYYDAGLENSYVGYPIGNVDISCPTEFSKWTDNFKELSLNFERLTGVTARLIGGLDLHQVQKIPRSIKRGNKGSSQIDPWHSYLD